MQKYKVTHSQSRTKQVQQYEPHQFSYTVEREVELKDAAIELPLLMKQLEQHVSNKLDEDISGLKQDKEKS